MPTRTLLLQPWLHAAVFLALTAAGLFLASPATADRAWQIGGWTYLLFVAVSTGACVFATRPWVHVAAATACSVVYVWAAGAVIEGFVERRGLEGSGESALIFLAVIVHPVALALVAAARHLAMRNA